MLSTPTTPHAEGPEKSVISSILKDSVEYIPRAIEHGITPERFYSPALSILYKVFLEEHSKGGVIEVIALSQRLEDMGKLESIGGRATLMDLYAFATTGAHFDSHCKIVMEKSQLRSVIKFGTEMIGKAYADESISELIPQLELGALTIGRDAEEKSGYNYSLKSAYKELWDQLTSEDLNGIPMGWPQLDALTGGLHAGEVTVIGARPAMGKTAFAISLAENLALQQQVPTALFAVEGKRTYLTTRLVSMAAHVPAKRIRDRVANKSDQIKMQRSMANTKDSPLWIDDRVSNAVEIAAKIRRLHQQSPLKVVIIDYIQKLPAALPDERSNLRLRIINATDVLHQTCKALDISLVLLAQLGRDSPNDDPSVNALKESGSLEQDGDTIILLGSQGNEPEDPNTPHDKLIRIAKNRHGACGDISLNFTPTTTRFG